MKYRDRDLHLCFPSKDEWFVYPREELLDKILAVTRIAETDSGKLGGGYSFPTVSNQLREMLHPYRLVAEEARGLASV